MTRTGVDALVDEHFRAEAAGDLQAVADGAEHHVAGRPGPPLRGSEQIRAFYEGLLAELEITRFERMRRWCGADHVVDESLLHGIAREPFPMTGPRDRLQLSSESASIAGATVSGGGR